MFNNKALQAVHTLQINRAWFTKVSSTIGTQSAIDQPKWRERDWGE